MAAGKPRTKAIIFRIAQDDYDRIQSKVSANGVRSFADFARAQVLRAAGEPTLADVGERLNELEAAVQQLEQLVKSQLVKSTGAESE